MKDLSKNELAEQLTYLLPLQQATADLNNVTRGELGLIYADQYMKAYDELNGARAMRDAIFINADYDSITPELFEELLTSFRECNDALNECGELIVEKAKVLFPEVTTKEEEKGFTRFMKNLFGNLIK